MGTPGFSVPILKSINNSRHELLAVYTQPPKKKSRGQKIMESPVQSCAEKLKIPIRTPDSLKEEIEYNFIKKIKPNVVIVVAYGKVLPSRILNIKNIKFINIHTSLLPKWRGAAPIQRAIINMDKETGISIMKIEEELDAGPIMKTVKININKNSTYESLSKELSSLSAITIIECLDKIENKKDKFKPQDSSKVSYAKKIDKLEGKINWNIIAKKVLAKINALNPNPGCWFELSGSRIKVLSAKEINIQGNPGEVVNEQFTIACAKNSIQILQVKKEGKKSMSASDYLIGNKLKKGRKLDEF